MNRTILVTGGAGFIGGNFVEYWYRKHPSDRIIVLDLLTYAGNPHNIPAKIRNDQERFEFWYGDVCNGELVNTLMEKSNVVVHFAAETHVARSIYDNRIFFKTDVLGTQTVAMAVLNHQKTIDRFVHVSTSEVYGTAEREPMDEEHPLKPCSPYAAAKCGADRLVYAFMQTYDLPAVIVRPFNQYGPRQHLEKVVPRFITSALEGEPLTVHGDGGAKRDWLHVEDTCRRIEQVILAPRERVLGEVFNLGSGEVIGVREIAERILDILGKSRSLIKHVGNRPGQVACHHSSTEKARTVLSVEPGRRFEDGLRQTIEWYRENEQWWRDIAWMKCIQIKTAQGQIEMH